MKTRNLSICDFITEFFSSFGYIKLNKTKEENKQKGLKVDICTQYLVKTYLQEIS